MAKLKELLAALFARAARVAQTGTSTECVNCGRELEALVKSEAGELERSAPPQAGLRYHGDHAVNYTEPAGHDYAAAALAGDTERAARLAERWRMLATRRTHAEQLLEALQAREKVARAAEAKAAAPGRAAALADALAQMVTVVEAAAAEYARGRQGVVETVQQLLDTRELIDNDTGTVSMDLFRRAGLVLSHHLARRQATERPHLFESPTRALQLARALLPAPAPSIIGKLKAIYRRVTSTDYDAHRDREPDAGQIAAELSDFHRERLKLITEGRIADAERLEPRAREIGDQGPRFVPVTADAPRGIEGGRAGAAVRKALSGEGV